MDTSHVPFEVTLDEIGDLRDLINSEAIDRVVRRLINSDNEGHVCGFSNFVCDDTSS